MCWQKGEPAQEAAEHLPEDDVRANTRAPADARRDRKNKTSNTVPDQPNMPGEGRKEKTAKKPSAAKNRSNRVKRKLSHVDKNNHLSPHPVGKTGMQKGGKGNAGNGREKNGYADEPGK